MKRELAKAIAAVVVGLGGCGGGDSGSLEIGPLWIDTGVAAADVDGDGLIDVVSVATLARGFGDSDGQVKVYRQGASGTFVTDAYAVGRYPWKVAISDVDGDGRSDLLVLDVVGGSVPNSGALYLLLQDPAVPGRFLPPRSIAHGLSTYDFAAADVNADGAPDIVVAGPHDGADGALLLVQDLTRRGAFLPAAILALPGRGTQVAAGDLNADGLSDLAIYATTGFSTSTGSSGLPVIVPARDDGFGTRVALRSEMGLNAELMAIVDADGDGRADVLLVFNPFSANYGAKLTVHLQTGAGVFSPIDTPLGNLEGTEGFVVADLDGDGRPDLATTGAYPVGSPTRFQSTTNILQPTGGGAYGVVASYAMPVSMHRINAADIDGDGRNDLILLGGDHQVFVMTQSRTAPGTFLPPRAL